MGLTPCGNPFTIRGMKRSATKKSGERRRRPRSGPSSGKSASPGRVSASETAKQASGARGEPTARTRGKPSTATETSRSVRAGVDPDACHTCAKKLSGDAERALFVEEEVGRIFCSEACIATFFTPEITRLEKEYFKRLQPSDLSAEERESLAHLRWITLQEPDEIWREKTLSGDFRYTLISDFKTGREKSLVDLHLSFLAG